MPNNPSSRMSRRKRSSSKRGNAVAVAVANTDTDADADADVDVDVDVDDPPTTTISASSVTESISSKMSSSRLMHSIIEIICHDIIFMTSLPLPSSLSSSSSSTGKTTGEMDAEVAGKNRGTSTSASTNSKSTTEQISDIEKVDEINKVRWKRRMYKIENEFDVLWKKIVEGSGRGEGEDESDCGSHCVAEGAVTGRGTGRLHCYDSMIQFFKFMYRYCYKNGSGEAIEHENNRGIDGKVQIEDQRRKWDELSKRLTELKSIIMNPNSRQIEILPTHQFDSIDDSQEEQSVEENNGSGEKITTITSSASTMSEKEKKDYESKLKIHEKEYQLVQMKLSIQHCLSLLYQKDEEDYNGKGKDLSKNAEAFDQCINDGRFKDHPQTYDLLSSFIVSVLPRRTRSTPTRTPTSNTSMKRLRKSRKEIKQIIEDNTNWLDWRVVMYEIELLVQAWCRTCIPTPEFRPELYIYYSKLQLRNQMKMGENQDGQLNLNHPSFQSNSGTTHIDRVALTIEEQEKKRSGQQASGENDEVENDFECEGEDEDQQQCSRKGGESQETTKEKDRNDKHATNAMRQVKNLKKKRRQLKKNVKDPLPDVLAKASVATGEHNLATQDSNAKGADFSDTNMSNADDFYSATSSLDGTSQDNRYDEKTPAEQAQKMVVWDDSDSTTDDAENAAMPNKRISNSRDDDSTGTNTEKETSSTRKMDENNRVPSIYQKKRSAVSLEFTESSQSQTDDDSTISSPKRKKRQMFTEEEKKAIKEGQQKFGNAWSMIQKYYPVLKDRDQGSIKDCFRNMKKRFEV